MIVLKASRHHEGQEIEIHVKYDEATNQVKEIKAVTLKSHGNTFPIGTFMMAIAEFDEAIIKIVKATDWHQLYLESKAKEQRAKADFAARYN